MTDEQKEMIEKFQCPGCTYGGDTKCEAFEFDSNDDGFGYRCVKHSAGTYILGIDKIALGLPKGFNHIGIVRDFCNISEESNIRSTNIRLFTNPKETIGLYDRLNLPVWAMEKDGYLFIRSFSPRINYTFVDIIKNGKFNEICPNAVNVAEFLDDID